MVRLDWVTWIVDSAGDRRQSQPVSDGRIAPSLRRIAADTSRATRPRDALAAPAASGRAWLLAACLLMLAAILSPVVAQAESAEQAEPPEEEVDPFDLPVLYLTWQRDPTRTMTVHWWSDGSGDRPDEVRYRPVADGTAPGGMLELQPEGWQSVTGSHKPFPKVPDRVIHTVELTGLQPDTVYEFEAGVFPERRRFRTMPAVFNRPIRFVQGGDVYKQKRLLDAIYPHAAATDPDFCVIGGDLAYSEGRAERVHRWWGFMHQYTQEMVTSDGRTIPMLVTIGNHEVTDSGYGDDKSRATFFYDVFSFPGETGYNVLDFGNYLTMVFLDSGHTTPIAGKQKAWLHQTLKERKDAFWHIMAVYHVPAWPSVRSPYSGVPRLVRRHWVPIFEWAEVDLVFENHDHSFKRTLPIRDGEVHPHGVVYLGDGAWGVTTRDAVPPGGWLTGGRWYLARSGEVNHVWLITLDQGRRTAQAIDLNGTVFDELIVTDGLPVPFVRDYPRGNVWAVAGVAAVVGVICILITVLIMRRPAKPA